ncbi:MAG: hypothetical protein HY428_00845 [Candidatus Levybacteria bacterium]|nr:hypothetical protein [Candidatus Levybacteria bacterium]
MKIATIKKKYKNEWVLVKVVKEDTLNQPTEGKVIAHGKNRDVIYEKMRKLPAGFRVATFYTGKIPPKDMAFAFQYPA